MTPSLAGTPPETGWRTILMLGFIPVLLLALLGAGRWGYVRWRASTRDARAAEELAGNFFGDVAHSPADFERILALCESPDPTARTWAVAGAAFAARQGAPTRGPRATAVAVRLLDDPVSEVRVRAIVAVGNLGACDHIECIRPFLTAANPDERRVAIQTLGQLEAGPPN